MTSPIEQMVDQAVGVNGKPSHDTKPRTSKARAFTPKEEAAKASKKKAKKPSVVATGKQKDTKTKKSKKKAKAQVHEGNGHTAPGKNRGEGGTYNEVIIARLLKGSKQKPVSRDSLKEALRKAFPDFQEYYIAKYVSDALSWHINKRKSLEKKVVQAGDDKYYLVDRKVK